MDRLQREVNQLFDSYGPTGLRHAPGYPAMNVWTNSDGLVVTAEVPGVNPEDIDVNITGETMTLSGERKPDIIDESVRYHRHERGYGQFSRSLQLPFPVDVNEVDATFKNGVLYLTMPRAEQDKPRKITVKSA
jgi:HSP20 family protein